MTTYTAVTSGQRDAESPIDVTLIGQMIDNPIAITEKAAGAPVLADDYVTTAMIAASQVTQAKVAASAIGQGELKTATGVVSNSGSVQALYTLPGGTYGFYPQLKASDTTAVAAGLCGDLDNKLALTTSYVTRVSLARTGNTVYAQQRYIQACPPYDHGDGLIAQYAFALLDKNGTLEGAYVAEDAPWHNNGPTDIRADYYDEIGRGWRLEDVFEETTEPEDFTDYSSIAQAAGWRSLLPEEVDLQEYFDSKFHARFTDGKARSDAKSWKALCKELGLSVKQVLGKPVTRRIPTGKKQRIEITQAIKHADMALIPHPFIGNDLTGKTVVLLDPVNDSMHRMKERQLYEGVSLSELLHDGAVTVGNEALNRSGPAGVQVVPFRLK